jgi:hypothetical protein
VKPLLRFRLENFIATVGFAIVVGITWFHSSQPIFHIGAPLEQRNFEIQVRHTAAFIADRWLEQNNDPLIASPGLRSFKAGQFTDHRKMDRYFLVDVPTGGILVGTHGKDRIPSTDDDYFIYVPLNT